ncbi:MAG: DsbA family protein [Alphaproteobacteria bacterium]|nr:DsbA family protein [Alphaproteobacteria bacterium]MCY3754326.1 DsbA family protein [Alphaproteobacteria bacterium]
MTLLSRAVLAVLLAALACLPWTAREARADAEQEVAAVIEYLRQKDPEIVLKAVQAWWDEQEEYRRQRQVGRIAANWEALARAEGDPAIGPEDADAVLVEFFDYRCGFCKRVLGDVMALAAADSRLRIVFKEFPILGPLSVVAARASLAADRQGKWTEFHVALMSAPGALSEDRIMDIAAETGLDIAQLRVDMESEAVTAVIERNRVLANALGIGGTPAFLVKNAIVPGAASQEDLAKLVAGAREAG